MHTRRIALFGAAFVLATQPVSAQVKITPPHDWLMCCLSIPADADVKGMWSAPFDWPIIGIHAAVMPTGSVLTYGSPTGKNANQDGRTFDIWDPSKGTAIWTHYTMNNAWMVDSFCSSAAFMASGSMLITGGASYSSPGSPQSSVTFDPATNAPYRLSAAPGPVAATVETKYPRWYGTMITLSDGRLLMVGGGKAYANAVPDIEGTLARNEISMTPEVYSPATGWKELPGATSRDAAGPENNRWWYPRLWVAPKGNVFGISADKMWGMGADGIGGTYTFGDFKKGFTYSTTDTPNTGNTSTAVMYDVGRILQVGGNGATNGMNTTSSQSATVIDISSGWPVLTEQAPMLKRRQWANSTVLPNGEVLITGGSSLGDNAGANAMFDAESWDPTTGVWSLRAKASVYRGYHSAATLLPNGTVLTTGGGVPGPVANFNGEIYYPPYLFKKVAGVTQLAPRPAVDTVNSLSQKYAQPMTITLSTRDKISKVSVIGLSNTTHSFNTGQRFYPAPFTQTGSTITATMPADGNIAPPGYYLVYVVNTDGVPSRGVIISLGAMAPVPKDPPTLKIGDTISFENASFPTRRVRHFNWLVDLMPVSTNPAERRTSNFIVRPGLWNSNCYSFEAVGYPGLFMRHSFFRVKTDLNDGTDVMRKDATFCLRAPLNGETAAEALSLEPLAWRGYALRQRSFQIWLDPVETTNTFKWDASFRRRAPL